VARSADPTPAAIKEGVRSETSSALKQLNDQDDNSNHEQEMNQPAAKVADEAEKPKNDEDDYYGPEHVYAFPLSWFKRRIPTKSREKIKQKLYHRRGDEPRCA
jgi:hypothetical protein